MQHWHTTDREVILDLGKFLKVERHTVSLPNGDTITDWPWVVTPDYVNIVVTTTDGAFLCFEQTKYAVEGSTLAIVGGYLEPGEEPLAAARRELLEETGYVADSWLSLGRYAVDGNRGAGIAHLFLAENAQPQQAIAADDLEEQVMLHLSRAEVEQALAEGQFKVLPWTAALALALCRSARE